MLNRSSMVPIIHFLKKNLQKMSIYVRIWHLYVGFLSFVFWPSNEKVTEGCHFLILLSMHDVFPLKPP